MDDLIVDFLEEAQDHLQHMDGHLKTLEKDIKDEHAAIEIFRILHMIKGASSFVPLPELENTLHDAESHAQRLTNGQASPQDVNALKTYYTQIDHTLKSLHKEHSGSAAPDHSTFGGLCAALPAIVESTAATLGKDIALKVKNKDIAVSEQIGRVIKPILVQLVRNACDHGIEDVETREESGKIQTGRILLSAEDNGQAFTFSIRDDGAGLDGTRLKAAALCQNFKSLEELDALSEDDVYGLIFMPGLSTSDNEANVSGRGIGMDIAQNQIQKMNGQIAVRSKPGKGCQFIIHIPKT